MNDKQYNDFINKQLEENEEAHFSNVEHNKKRTWNLIEYRLKRKKIIPLWFYYAAASIILFFCVGFVFNSELKHKNNEIAILNSKIAEFEQNEIEKVKIIKKTDTVILTKDKLIYIPVIEHDTVSINDTTVKLITQIDTIFIKEKLPELITENEISNPNILVDNKLRESNQIKTKKKRRFVFRFGVPGKNNENRVQKEPLISLKTELK